MVGATLDGRYRVLRKLGEGGMGEVYLVEHVALGRQEALKILHAAYASAPTFVSRFRREARATNRVQHPSIVSVHDFGRLPDGRFYLSMEYADGESLHRLLARTGPLALPRALHVLHQLAVAVEHAHGHGVIHRDLKPDNLVLVEHRGRADVLKVLDFGMAKIIAPDHQETLQTRRGEVFGTPQYMAPEQLNGDMTDPRIDLYALGCIAFELVVGAPPFTGRNLELMDAHLRRAPDAPSARKPDARLPRELDDVVLRCLEKDADRRFQSAREVAAALERVPGFGTHAASVARRRLDSARAATLRLATIAPPPSGFDEATATSQPQWVQAPLTVDGGALTLLEPGEPAMLLRLTVRELVEALLDAGVRDLQLAVGLGSLKEMEDDLLRVDSEIAALEAHSDELERSARAREDSLRFALGELAFERQQAQARGERIPPQLGQQLRDLEQRIARNSRERTQQLEALTDRSIERVAARAGVEERLDATCARLASLAAGHLPLERAPLAIATLAARLERLQHVVARGAENAG
ncbi:MAG TPA: protein kinase [Polyangia bacterium]|nr:protein kinase [Polyangia bacterium]